MPAARRQRTSQHALAGLAGLAAALAAVGAAVLGGCSSAGDGAAVELTAPAPTGPEAAECRRLVRAVPGTVADQPAREVRGGRGYAAAWGDPAIVLTCGGPAPRGFGRTSTCTTVNGVDWFAPEAQLEAEGDLDLSTVYRRPFVRVRLPAAYWPPATAMADLAPVIRQHTRRTGRCR